MIRTKKVLKANRFDKRAVNVTENLMELSKSSDSQAEVYRCIFNKGLLVLASELRFGSDESLQASFAEAMEERLDDYEALEPLEKKSESLLKRDVRGSLAPMVVAIALLAVVLVLALLFVFGKFGM